MTKPGFTVIHEDNHLLAVDKPSGLPSQPDSSGDASLDLLAKEYLKEKYGKPGDVYLGLVHRLDRPTSGVMVLARTDKAAGRMSELFRRRAVVKRYLALVECAAPPEREARLIDLLSPLPNGGMRVATADVPEENPSNTDRKTGRKTGGKERKADLAYSLLETLENGRRALLRIDLGSGVKHQIRCQLAARGLPVVGDFRYGAFGGPASPEPVAGGRAILLHASSLEFEHPVRREPLVLTAPTPDHWEPFLKNATLKNLQ